MLFVMGFIVGVGLIVSIYSIVEDKKRVGIVQLVLSIVTPIFTFLFLQKKSQFVFGGTDWEFLIQTAIIDKLIESWLIFILHVVIIAMTIYKVVQFRKNKKSSLI